MKTLPALALLALISIPFSIQAQDPFIRAEEDAPIWGPTFTVEATQVGGVVHLEWAGHAALNVHSRRIDTLDILAKFDDKKTEKTKIEGVDELKDGKLEFEGAWKEIRFSYKTLRPGTLNSKDARVTCRLNSKKVTLPVKILFESYEEGSRCSIDKPERKPGY